MILRPGALSPVAPGDLVELRGTFPTSDLIALPEVCDEAAVIVADDRLGRQLRDAGLRVPIVGPETDAAEEAARWDPSAVPRLIGSTLGHGGSYRRFARPLPVEKIDIDPVIDDVVTRLDDAQRAYAAAHELRFRQTLSRVGPARPGGTALELSSFPVMTQVLEHLGYWLAASVRDDVAAVARPTNPFDASFGRRLELVVDLETERLACDDALFDLVLACEIIEHLPRDPMQLLVEANRVLRTGGRLIVTTPNIVGEHSIGLSLTGVHPANYYFFERSGSLDRHHFEWTPALVGDALRAAGFVVDALDTCFSWWESDPSMAATLDAAGHPRHLRGDNIIAVATKVSSFVERTPDSLYVGDGGEWTPSYRARPRIPPAT